MAVQFAKEKGLILELQQCHTKERYGNLRYFNCSLVSAYANEDERLFFGDGGNGLTERYKIEFKSIRLIEQKHNLQYFIKVLTSFQKFINNEPTKYKVTSNESFIIRRLTNKHINKLSSSINKEENKDLEIPQYINELFKRFCVGRKDKIIFNLYEMSEMNKKYLSCFMSPKAKNLINFTMISKLFPNITQIKCIAADYDIEAQHHSSNVISKNYFNALSDELDQITKYNAKLTEIKISTNKKCEDLDKLISSSLQSSNWKIETTKEKKSNNQIILSMIFVHSAFHGLNKNK